MASLNIELDYPKHPKTTRLKAWLGECADCYPIRLWAYAGTVHPKDGALRGYTIAEVEKIVDWAGEPGLLVRAMLEVGFLERLKGGKGGFRCHDWVSHEGHIWAYKVHAKKMAIAKWKKMSKPASSDGATSNAVSIHKASP